MTMTQLAPTCYHHYRVPSRATAVMLALFLGGLGAHWFYLSRPLRACTYLVFCWTLVPSVVSLFDVLCFAVNNDDTWRAKFGKWL